MPDLMPYKSCKVDPNVFPKGTHIVLLSGCNGTNIWEPDIPNNYIYQLRANSSTFSLFLEKDAMGSQNGWSGSGNLDKMRLREAMQQEIAAYEKYGPCSIEKAKEFIFEYEIY